MFSSAKLPSTLATSPAYFLGSCLVQLLEYAQVFLEVGARFFDPVLAFIHQRQIVERRRQVR